MEKLDLHGVRHSAADEKIRIFLNFVELPCQIITGNSREMKNIVEKLVREYGWHCYEKSTYNYGTLTVSERKIR